MTKAKGFTPLNAESSGSYSRNLTGFTLIEIIIYVGIMGLVMTALVMFALSISNNRDKAASASEVEANTKIIWDQISVLVHRARSLDTANSVWDSDQGKLVLFLDMAKTQTAVISVENGQVSVQLAPASPYIISSRAVNVSRLKFSRLADRQIGLDLIVAYGAPGAVLTPEKAYEQTLTTAISLR